MSRSGAAAALCALALLCVAAGATAGAGAQGPGDPPAPPGPRVLLAFLPASEPPADGKRAERPPPPTVLERLDRRERLALGFVGATQGRYQQEQALLDLTQGTRVSIAAYDPRDLPELGFVLSGPRAYIEGWDDAVRRASSAPAEIVPGLLASSIPGGVGYAGVSGRAQTEAIVAADRSGTIAAVSIGRARDVAARARALLGSRRLVVAALPTGAVGGRALDELIAARAPGELLLVVETPPDRRAPQMLPAGVGVADGTPGQLTSDTTRRDGLVAGIDVLPTVLRHLGLRVPDGVKGEPIRIEGRRDAAALQRLEDRLRVVGPRRIPALETLLLAWLSLLLALGVARERRGTLAALRIGALAMLWVPAVLLLTAALQPSRQVEFTIIAAGTLALAALTDALVRWPRGPLVPAAVGVAAYIADLAFGSELIVRSLLGPNPRFGSRFYGIGNELEATLPILLFFGIAGALAARGRSRGGAAAFALGGLVLGAAIGSGRLGADVGGVITVGAGAAIATLLMLPGGPSRRAIALAALVPGAALAGLAALDLATGGNGHFTRTVLHAQSAGDLADIIVRRYELAFNQLTRGLMPFITGIAILTIVYGLRHGGRLYAPVAASPAWRAAFAGGLGVGVAGALFNDSGPLLLVFAVFILAFMTAYVRGDPRLLDGPGSPADRSPDGAARSGEAVGSAPGPLVGSR